RDQSEHPVAGREHVDQRRLHPSRARAGQDEDVVVRLEEGLEAGHGLREDLAELVGAVVQDRPRQRLLDGGMDGRRTGREESELLDHDLRIRPQKLWKTLWKLREGRTANR